MSGIDYDDNSLILIKPIGLNHHIYNTLLNALNTQELSVHNKKFVWLTEQQLSELYPAFKNSKNFNKLSSTYTCAPSLALHINGAGAVLNTQLLLGSSEFMTNFENYKPLTDSGGIDVKSDIFVCSEEAKDSSHELSYIFGDSAQPLHVGDIYGLDLPRPHKIQYVKMIIFYTLLKEGNAFQVILNTINQSGLTVDSKTASLLTKNKLTALFSCIYGEEFEFPYFSNKIKSVVGNDLQILSISGENAAEKLQLITGYTFPSETDIQHLQCIRQLYPTEDPFGGVALSIDSNGNMFDLDSILRAKKKIKKDVSQKNTLEDAKKESSASLESSKADNLIIIDSITEDLAQPEKIDSIDNFTNTKNADVNPNDLVESSSSKDTSEKDLDDIKLDNSVQSSDNIIDNEIKSTVNTFDGKVDTVIKQETTEVNISNVEDKNQGETITDILNNDKDSDELKISTSEIEPKLDQPASLESSENILLHDDSKDTPTKINEDSTINIKESEFSKDRDLIDHNIIIDPISTFASSDYNVSMKDDIGTSTNDKDLTGKTGVSSTLAEISQKIENNSGSNLNTIEKTESKLLNISPLKPSRKSRILDSPFFQLDKMMSSKPSSENLSDIAKFDASKSQKAPLNSRSSDEGVTKKLLRQFSSREGLSNEFKPHKIADIDNINSNLENLTLIKDQPNTQKSDELKTPSNVLQENHLKKTDPVLDKSSNLITKDEAKPEGLPKLTPSKITKIETLSPKKDVSKNSSTPKTTVNQEKTPQYIKNRDLTKTRNTHNTTPISTEKFATSSKSNIPDNTKLTDTITKPTSSNITREISLNSKPTLAYMRPTTSSTVRTALKRTQIDNTSSTAHSNSTTHTLKINNNLHTSSPNKKSTGSISNYNLNKALRDNAGTETRKLQRKPPIPHFSKPVTTNTKQEVDFNTTDKVVKTRKPPLPSQARGAIIHKASGATNSLIK
ncbi:hypothetical protein BB561_000768 [Smittium simulii]|uniref:Nucleoside diphosphate kinase n=1 Tax=Smittium simulii TaxID=133385 RepID=A0A2T9YXM3_9FUNG|nr:hypothetical protein BB561_000768 [Smittium simulii]